MDRKRKLIIIGLAAGSAFLITLFYAIDTCLIGAPYVYGGDFHILNIDHAVRQADMIVIGTVKKVEKRTIDESYELRFNETGYTDKVVQITPYWFVTIDADQYLLDRSKTYQKEVTFIDASNGCAVIHGERVNLQSEDWVTYSKGERALYFIYDRNGYKHVQGETSKFAIREDELSSWVMKKYDVEPIKLADLADKINQAVNVDMEKLQKAHEIVTEMMGKHDSDIPIVMAWVDPEMPILVVVIDDKAPLPLEEYEKRLKELLGDIPMRVELGHFEFDSSKAGGSD